LAGCGRFWGGCVRRDSHRPPDPAHRTVGSASGLLESSQQLGASLRVAILATLFFTTISLVPDESRSIRKAAAWRLS
jgi:hypothetical protein